MADEIDVLLDALPLGRFALLFKMAPWDVRTVCRASIQNAISDGVTAQEAARRIGVMMRAALDMAAERS